MAAVAQRLTFPGSASAHQLYHHGADNGEVNIAEEIHERAEGIEQFRTGKIYCIEVVRALEILLCKIQTQMDVMPRPASTHDIVSVDIEFNRCEERDDDVVPALAKCDGEGDGGHRCPYFPCPDCHRTRSIFIPESNTTLKTYCEDEDEVADYHQETLAVFEIGSSVVIGDSHVPSNKSDEANDQTCGLPVVTTIWDGEGDGGHRCPYFPCPDCHRSRSISIPETSHDHCKVSFPSLNTVSHVHDIVNHPSLMITSVDDQGRVLELLTCPDKGHTCPYFPCPICHRTR